MYVSTHTYTFTNVHAKVTAGEHNNTFTFFRISTWKCGHFMTDDYKKKNDFVQDHALVSPSFINRPVEAWPFHAALIHPYTYTHITCLVSKDSDLCKQQALLERETIEGKFQV